MQQNHFLQQTTSTFYASWLQLENFLKEYQTALLVITTIALLTVLGLSPEEVYAKKLDNADGTGSKVTKDTVSLLKTFLTWVVYIVAAFLFILAVVLMMKSYKDWVGKKEDLSHVIAVVLVGIIIIVIALVLLNQGLGYLDELK